jgi:hypothetical protein
MLEAALANEEQQFDSATLYCDVRQRRDGLIKAALTILSPVVYADAIAVTLVKP